jgi:hypothetical protein
MLGKGSGPCRRSDRALAAIGGGADGGPQHGTVVEALGLNAGWDFFRALSIEPDGTVCEVGPGGSQVDAALAAQLGDIDARLRLTAHSWREMFGPGLTSEEAEGF